MDNEAYLNKSELVQRLLSTGVPAHRGLSYPTLRDMYAADSQGDIVDSEYVNPVNALRTEVMEFITQYADVLLPQLGCDGNCFNHTDAQVVSCHLKVRSAR